MESDRILASLDQIPWSTLEHAYGNAGDIPDILRTLVSGDPDQREWAQDMLDMGPFHQGSLYSCTPYVVRVLLQIAEDGDAADLPWILQYVSAVLAAANAGPPELGFLARDPETARELVLEQAREQEFATQIQVEVRSQGHVLTSKLDHPDAAVRIALLRLLVLLKADFPQLEAALAEKLSIEIDESVRAAEVFCLSLEAGGASHITIQAILEKTAESPLVRLAAGFGLIAAMREHIGDQVVTTFCDLIANNFDALDNFEELYADYLTPLGAPPGNDRLLDCLQQRWPAHQLDQIIHTLLHIYAQLPTAKSYGVRIGSAYYLETMVRLAFPDGKLAPATTIRDLNDTQRCILEAFQCYDMPSVEWNVYGPFDYRWELGFDFRSETDFLDFMSGERPARQATE